MWRRNDREAGRGQKWGLRHHLRIHGSNSGKRDNMGYREKMMDFGNYEEEESTGINDKLIWGWGIEESSMIPDKCWNPYPTKQAHGAGG